MKSKVKIAIISFFSIFLSSLNLKNGLNSHVTDASVRDIASVEAKEEAKIDTIKKPSIKSVNIPKQTVKTVSTTKKTASTQTTAKNVIKIAGKTITLKPTDCSKMPKPDYSSANYCNFGGSKSLFVYGHNVSNIFGTIKNLKVGSTFSVTLNGQTTTYRITHSFTRTKEELNANSNLRRSIYVGTYLGNSDITIQTCEGKNDYMRRYIKAVRI